MLNALGVFDKKAPQYTATVIIELHKTTAGHEVKVFYKNVTKSNDTHQLQLPGITTSIHPVLVSLCVSLRSLHCTTMCLLTGCQSPCSLQSFTKLVDQYKISDWDLACGNIETTTPTKHTVKGLTEGEWHISSAVGRIANYLISLWSVFLKHSFSTVLYY